MTRPDSDMSPPIDPLPLDKRLFDLYGPLLGGQDLCVALGYRSSAALRQARKRGKVGVRTFALPGRKGTFASTTEVAAWLKLQMEGDRMPDD